MRTLVRLSVMTLIAAAAAGCDRAPPVMSLVGDFPAPGTYALAGDTITVWKRIPRPGGAWYFQSFSITPGGTVETLEHLELGDAPPNPEDAAELREKRKAFTLSPADFEAIRTAAARLRPGAMGPRDAVGGYGGEVVPSGCTLDKAAPRVAGINFLNSMNWGAFTLQAVCQGDAARAANELFDDIHRRLARDAERAVESPS